MNEKVQELLADWEIARQDGKQISADELCRDCPELLPQLKAGIEKLLTTSWLFETSEEAAPAPVLPQPRSRAEFLQRVKELELVPESEFEKIDVEADVDTIAGNFRRAGSLTSYQAEVLLGYKNGPIKLDRYIVLDEIGEGGMGKVYKALHTSMNRNVAIKMLSAASISDQRKSRFRREIQSVASLSHPNVVTAYDACEVDGQFILAMELIDGEDLTEVIRNHGVMDFDSAAEVIRQIACAAAAAHRKGIIHRDIKPSNILLAASTGEAKLLDLGIARIQDESSQGSADSTWENSTDITGENIPIGTIAFMSPEQAMNARQADERSDIYSLGCTFYYLLAGKTPFPGDNAVEVIVAHRELPTQQVLDALDVPEYGRDVLHRMMAKQPEDRFASMDEVVEAIKQKLPVQKSRKLQTAANSGYEKSLWLLVGSLLLACCAAGVGWFNMDPGLVSPDSFLQMEGDTRENDLARWVLNNLGLVVATTEFGEQTIDTIEAIPDSPIKISEISLSETPANFSIQWLTELQELKALSLDRSTLTSTDAKALSELKKLETLALSFCELDESVWPALPQIPNLKALTLIEISCKKESLRVLKDLDQLTSLTINNMDFSDGDFRLISNMQNLEFLDLEGTNVKSNPIEWSAMQPKLEHLDLSGTNIEDDDLKNCPVCEQLSFISLESCRVGSTAAEFVSRLSKVTDVFLGGTNISDADLKVISAQTSLTSLDIQNTNVTGAGLRTLVALKQLEFLGLSGLDIGDEDLKPLLKLKNIDYLDLSGTMITDDAFDMLSRMNLTELQLTECDVSEEAISKFLEQNTDCSLLMEEIFLE